jgi:hypothetical protein
MHAKLTNQRSLHNCARLTESRAAGEEGVTMKAIVEAHGHGLKVPAVSIKPRSLKRTSAGLFVD